METRFCHFMHRDIPVCAVEIDPVSGAMLRISKPQHPELLPVGTSSNADALRIWWQRRAVPSNQACIRQMLRELRFDSPQNYLLKNLGLSMSDHYWLCPQDMDLAWQTVNFFTNDFFTPFSASNAQSGPKNTEGASVSRFSPASSVQGELHKQWIVRNGRRILVKGHHPHHSQESLNEVLATLLHRKQHRMPFVEYTAEAYPGMPGLSSVCPCFTSINTEFIPAIDAVSAEKRSNQTSLYEHLIAVCARHGLAESVTRPFMEYQILTDFILTNTDRHLNNFGILRDAESLQWIGMAPIFDSGNSMFWNAPKYPEHNDLTRIEVNSLRKTEKQLLACVRPEAPLPDFDALPTDEEILALYALDPDIEHTDLILKGYHKKIALLQNSFGR